MAIVIDKLNPNTQIAGNIGSTLGDALQGLIGSKVKQLQTASGLSSLMSPEQAAAVSKLSPEMQKIVIPQLLKQQEGNLLIKSLPNENQAQAPTNTPAPVETAPVEAVPVEQADATPVDTAQQSQQPPVANALEQNVEQSAKQELTGVEALQGKKFDYGNELAKGFVRARGDKLLAGKLADAAMQLDAAAKNQAFQEKKLNFAETKGYRDEVNKAAKSAESDLRSLKTQRDLVATKRLIGPKTTVFMDMITDKLGLTPLQRSAFKNNESVVFEKLSIPFFRSLKEIFGSNPNKFDAEQIAKGFPSLYQSDVGKNIIIDFMTMESRVKLERKKLMNNALKANNGTPPLDLDIRVDNQLESYKDKQYDIFRNRMDNFLVKHNAPPIDLAKKYGKGYSMQNKNGVIFESDGSKWTIMK